MLIFQKIENKEKRKKIEIEESLFTYIAQGDKSAFSELYEKTSSVIYAYVLSILKNPEDAGM